MQEDIDRWMKELKKGATKFSILTLLCDGDMYGYELRHEFEARTEGVMTLTESNAYPSLHGMESDGLITSYWVESGSGVPARKYYHLTESGEILLKEMIVEWDRYVNAINKIGRRKDGDQ
jgi:PadR family transcriptional regulator, regulatory protein PadR